MHLQPMQLHPRAPVLARQGGTLQVGLAEPVVLRGLGSEERAFVASLEGGRPVSPAHARRFSRVVTRLTNAGAWWEPAERDVASRTVELHGCGRLGMAIAFAMAEAGLDVALHDDAPIAVEEAGLYAEVAAAVEGEEPQGTCAGAAAVTLAERGVRVRVGGGRSSLAVVTCLGAPDPALISELMRTDTPHAVVTCTERDVWVSHVTVPGVSPCNRCKDLARAREDAEWPLVALQLAGPAQRGRRPAVSDAARPVVAGLVCSAIGRWRATGDAGVAYVVAEDGGIASARVLADPHCGCGAAPPSP